MSTFLVPHFQEASFPRLILEDCQLFTSHSSFNNLIQWELHVILLHSYVAKAPGSIICIFKCPNWQTGQYMNIIGNACSSIHFSGACTEKVFGGLCPAGPSIKESKELAARTKMYAGRYEGWLIHKKESCYTVNKIREPRQFCLLLGQPSFSSLHELNENQFWS